MNVGDENFYRIKAIPLSFYPFLPFSPRERGPGMLIKFREIVEKIYEKEKKKERKRTRIDFSFKQARRLFFKL